MIRAELTASGHVLIVERDVGLCVLQLTLTRHEALTLAEDIGRLLAEPEHRGEPVDDA